MQAGRQAHFYITTSSQASTVTVFLAMWNTTVNMQAGRPTSTSQRRHRLALTVFWGNVEYNCQHAGGQAHFYITTSSQASTVTVFWAIWNTTVNMQAGRQAHFYITTSSQASTVTVFWAIWNITVNMQAGRPTSTSQRRHRLALSLFFGQFGIQLSTCRRAGPRLHHNVVTG